MNSDAGTIREISKETRREGGELYTHLGRGDKVKNPRRLTNEGSI